jgi:hypothetical protein
LEPFAGIFTLEPDWIEAPRTRATGSVSAGARIAAGHGHGPFNLGFAPRTTQLIYPRG